jgi:Cu+-exporting ATPase
LTGTLTISGRVLFTTSYVGKDTILGRIFLLVQEAHGLKLRIQNFSDYIVSIFVPSVLETATFFLVDLVANTRDAVCHSSLRGGTDYFIGRPCTIGLDTRTAIIVGMG